MAVAQVEERQLLKKLRWYDGFVICLANPGFMLGSLGFSVLDLGGWGAGLIWGLTALIIVPVTILYSELAAMFPHKSGGVSIYANEGWRKYTTLVGPVATFGYWIGWSVSPTGRTPSAERRSTTATSKLRSVTSTSGSSI